MVFAAIVVIFGVIGFVMALIAGFSSGESSGGFLGLMMGLVPAFWAILVGSMLMATSEGIRLALDIQANTLATANAVQRNAA